MRVGIVYGGTSQERFASEKNAKDIDAALRSRGYETRLIEYGRDVLGEIKRAGADVVYVCVQGKGHGDGTIQGMLEHEGIPFTGSGMRAACLINDKILCKLLFDRVGIRTPRWDMLTRERYEKGDYPYQELGYPFVAKAPTQGGSFGIALIRGEQDLPRIADIFQYDDPILLERYIRGRFYTVGLFEGEEGLVRLPVVEGLDLDLEKTDEKEDSMITFLGNYGIRKHELSAECTEEMERMALKIFEVTQARGLARVDFMVSDEDGLSYALEINAVPGLKRASLMPQAAELAGIEYEDMIEDILKASLKNDDH